MAVNDLDLGTISSTGIGDVLVLWLGSTMGGAAESALVQKTFQGPARIEVEIC